MMGPTEPVVPGVISYNGDSERGWNDPPTLSFTGATASKKGPKLDLRKRVSHQEALTGRKLTSPLNPITPNLYNNRQTNQLANGLSNLSLSQQIPSQAVQSNMSPAISPCHSRQSSGSSTPPLGTDYSSFSGTTKIQPQYPAKIFPLSQPERVDGPTNNYTSPAQVPTTTNVAPPVAQTTNPPNLSSIVVPSSIGKPLFSFSNSFNVVPVSSALDISHVRSNPDILLDSSPSSSDLETSQNASSAFSNKEVVAQAPLIFTPSPTSTNDFVSLPNDANGSMSPVLNRAHQNGVRPHLYTPPPGSGRNSPLLPPTTNRSPISTPTDVHSACSTPRSSSPENGCQSNEASRHNSEEFDSQEAMRLTVEALEETIFKCSVILKNREAEDVKKKLGLMKQQWQDKKLSFPVQITMKSLAKALLENDTETAHNLHLKLMVEYVGEVKQWMVAIKRLTSAVGNLHSNNSAS